MVCNHTLKHEGATGLTLMHPQSVNAFLAPKQLMLQVPILLAVGPQKGVLNGIHFFSSEY